MNTSKKHIGQQNLKDIEATLLCLDLDLGKFMFVAHDSIMNTHKVSLKEPLLSNLFSLS